MNKIIIFGSDNYTSIENKYLSAFIKLKTKPKIFDTDSYFPKILKIRIINNIFLYPRILLNSLLLFIICLRHEGKFILIFLIILNIIQHQI